MAVEDVSCVVKRFGHVRFFLLSLEAVQDNVAADEQDHVFELVYFDSVQAVIFWQCTIRLLHDGALGAASNNVVKERDSCTLGQPPFRSRRDTNLSSTQGCLFRPTSW